MAQFNLRPVDTKSFPYFRGHTILRSLLTQRPVNGSSIVNHVLAAPGHFAVIVHGWSTCVLFDAVPSTHHANSTMQDQVIQAINAKRAVPSDCPIFCSTHSPPIAMVTIIDSSLYLLQRDGVLYCLSWRWSANEYMWRLFGRATPQTSPLPTIIAAVLHPRLKRLVCIEVSERRDRGWKLTQSLLSFDEQCTDPLKSFVLERADTVSYEREPLSRLYAAPDGVWVISGETREMPTQLLDLRTMQLHPVILPSTGVEFLLCAPYVPTGELLLLDAAGKVFVCRSEAQRHEPTVSQCVALIDFSRDDLQALAAHNGAALLFRSRSVSVVDLTSGALLRQEILPTRIESGRTGPWASVPGAEAGVWSEGGMWTLHWSSIANHAAAVARLPSSLENGLSPAASVCASWSLKSRSAAYLLEQAIGAGSNDELKKHACAALLPSVQNPALLIALLSGRHNQYLLKHVRDFTTRAACKSVYNTEEARRAAAHDAFAYWTPLNNSLLPLLQQFQALQERESQGPRNALSPLNVALSAGEMELVALDEPAPLLQSLEARFHINKASILSREAKVDDLLLLDETEDGVQYFDVMCVLYYSCDPEVLPYFVALVDSECKHRTAAVPPSSFPLTSPSSSLPPPSVSSTRTTLTLAPISSSSASVTSLSPPMSPAPPEEPTPVRSFFDRALYALPMLGEWSRPSSAQVLSRSKLLYGAQHPLDAVEMLLSYDLWEAAVAGVKERTTQDALHCDLFHALLDCALKRKSAERFVNLWDLKPLNYAALELFEAVEEALPPPPSASISDVLVSNDAQLPLSAFFPRLNELINAPPF